MTSFSYTIDFHPWSTLETKIRNITVAIENMSADKMEEQIEVLYKLPDSFLDEIGDSTFTTYPWDISFIERYNGHDVTLPKIDDQFIPLSAAQIYTTYTSRLDYRCRDLFAEENAPEYVILGLETIDDRLPFYEVPATWEAIRNNYEIVNFDAANNWYLLKHNDTRAYLSHKNRYETTVSKSGTMQIEGYYGVEVKLQLSLWGRIMKILWKIPALTAEIKYADGTIKEGRVLAETICNGLTIGGMPYDGVTFEDAMNEEGTLSTIKSIRLDGDGLDYYEDEVTLVYYKLEDDESTEVSSLIHEVEAPDGVISGIFANADFNAENISLIENTDKDSCSLKIKIPDTNTLIKQGYEYYACLNGVFYNFIVTGSNNVWCGIDLTGDDNIQDVNTLQIFASDGKNMFESGLFYITHWNYRWLLSDGAQIDEDILEGYEKVNFEGEKMLDSINEHSTSDSPIFVYNNERVSVNGWTYIVDKDRECYLLIGEKFVHLNWIDRADVRQVFSNENYSGYGSAFVLRDVDAGVYPVSLVIVDKKARTYSKTDLGTEIEVR